jgi:hypothetical protein
VVNAGRKLLTDTENFMGDDASHSPFFDATAEVKPIRFASFQTEILKDPREVFESRVPELLPAHDTTKPHGV